MRIGDETAAEEARKEWNTRLENLSPDQRAWLAARLAGYLAELMEAQASGVRLAAYVSPAGETAGPELVESVGRHLKHKLPEYMQPAAVRVLPALPHTPNGKLDRAALPDPLESRPAAVPQIAGEEELKVARLWEDLLGMEGVALDDNFFELGGHSLLVTRLLAQLNQWWGVEISVRDFFQEPTIAGLLQWKDRARSQPDAAPGRETFTF